jgi:hypothetical protein
MDAGALTAFRGKRTSLGDWILQWASTEITHLPLPALGQITYKDATYPGSDITLRLARGNTGQSGSATVKYGRLVPYDLEKQRVDRLRKACKDKLPKLKVCKDGGARTVLVLENSDGAITNYGYVRKALVISLAKLDRELEPEPDEVYQIDTDTQSWVIYPLRRDGADWDLSSMDDDEAFPTFDNNLLADLMITE